MWRVSILVMLLMSCQVFANEYLVKYQNTSAFSAMMSLSDTGEVKVLGTHTPGHLIKVDVSAENEAQNLANLLSNPSIEYVVPNFELQILQEPGENIALRSQWALEKVQAEKAWARAGNRGSKNIVVALIDTGADSSHESLNGNMLAGFDFIDNDRDPMDETLGLNPGHGTHCAGVIGATGLIAGGTVGISPEVSIMPLRALDKNGKGDLASAIRAIDYATLHGAQVISSSWGAWVTRATAGPLLEAIQRADQKGIIFVSAAANDGKNNDVNEVYPANNGFSNSITVAASGLDDEKPSWSNFGSSSVHLASPGVSILSTLPHNKYGEMNGTSMATPLVAGLVALLKAQDPALTGAQIRALLQTSGTPVKIQSACHCRVDAFAAVDAVKSQKLTVVPAAATMARGSFLTLSTVYGRAPFRFVSNHPEVASVNEAGVLTALSFGTTRVRVTDGNGKVASSLDFNVSAEARAPASNTAHSVGRRGLRPPQLCPLGKQKLCDVVCKVQPHLRFCN
jgi:thermitase